MKPTTPDMIRNVALISHGGAGKTSLAEAMLFDAGAISRLGTVEAGTTALDWDPDEHRRGQSINLADRLARARRRAGHDRRHARLRRLPGRCRRGAGGRRRGDRRGRRLGRRRGRHRGGLEARRRARPAADGVHQQDGPRERELRRRRSTSSRRASARRSRPVYLPIGSAESFRGYVDVIEEHASVYENGQPKEVPIPPELEGIEHSRRDALVEAAAEASDELMMKYLEGEAFTDEEIESALHKGTREGSVVPVFVGSATKNIGVRELTPMIVKHIPSPAEVGTRTTVDGKEIKPDPSGPFVAQVFKATADPFVGRLTYFRVVSGTLSGPGPRLQRQPEAGGARRQLPGGPGQGHRTTSRRSAPATSPPSPS